MRVAPDGTISKIDLGDWAGDCLKENYGPYVLTGTVLESQPSLSVITNADAGAAIFAYLDFQDACGGTTTPQTQVSFVAQDSITSQVNDAANAPVPALQREDGSYIGADMRGNLLAIGVDGSVVWKQPIGAAALTPQYATADGGAIVTSTAPCQQVSQYAPFGRTPCPLSSQAQNPLGTRYTIDQSGSVTSQIPDPDTKYSWTGHWYDPPPAGGMVTELNLATINLASTFAGIFNGNASQNGAAVQQTWFPPLPSCHDTTLNPPVPCPGPYEVADSALTALRSFVSTCQNCAGLVFQPLGSANDKPNFSKWLNEPAGLFDGRHSSMPLVYTCTSNTWNDLACYAQSGLKTVGDWFQAGGGGISNITKTPFRYGLLTFYDPYFLELHCAVISSTTSGFWHQSTLFHEALHGFYGKFDADIQQAFSLQVDPNSINITQYIYHYAFAQTGSGSCTK